MRCEVIAAGAELAASLASQLKQHGIDVRLTEPDVELLELRQEADHVAVDLFSPSDRTRVAVEAGFVVREGETDRSDRVFTVAGPDDVRNLGWKLAAVLRGANDVLLDSYLIERTARNYRGSPLSQELGGRRARIRAGDEIPDIVLWDNANETDLSLADLVRGPVWTLLGMGSSTAGAVQATAVKFGDRVQTQVVGGGASRAPGITLVDRYGHANRRLSKRGGSVLVVRPDGFLGLRGAPKDEIITAYLEDLLPSR